MIYPHKVLVVDATPPSIGISGQVNYTPLGEIDALVLPSGNTFVSTSVGTAAVINEWKLTFNLWVPLIALDTIRQVKTILSYPVFCEVLKDGVHNPFGRQLQYVVNDVHHYGLGAKLDNLDIYQNFAHGRLTLGATELIGDKP